MVVASLLSQAWHSQERDYLCNFIVFRAIHPILILPSYGELSTLLFAGKRAQLDSSGCRLKLKGDLETECSSNRWWQVGDSGGWRRARDSVTHGVAPRMLIAPRNPRRLYLDDSHTSRHTHTHTHADTYVRARAHSYRSRKYVDLLFVERPLIQTETFLPLVGHSFSMEIPVDLLLKKVSDTRCGLDILS